MTLQTQTGINQDGLDEGQVVEYLQQQPDFFSRQLDLLTQLVIPHDCGKAASLIERQVEILRSQNYQYKAKLGQLVLVARENDFLYERIQNLTLTLLDKPDLQQLLSGLSQILRNDFEVDALVLRIWNEQGNLIPECLDDGRPVEPAAVGVLCAYLEEQKPLCGKLCDQEHDVLFAGMTSQIHSSAIIPLRLEKGKGILVLGSYDKNRFQEGMGNLFLSYMGRLLSKLCAKQC